MLEKDQTIGRVPKYLAWEFKENFLLQHETVYGKNKTALRVSAFEQSSSGRKGYVTRSWNDVFTELRNWLVDYIFHGGYVTKQLKMGYTFCTQNRDGI